MHMHSKTFLVEYIYTIQSVVNFINLFLLHGKCFIDKELLTKPSPSSHTLVYNPSALCHWFLPILRQDCVYYEHASYVSLGPCKPQGNCLKPSIYNEIVDILETVVDTTHYRQAYFVYSMVYCTIISLTYSTDCATSSDSSSTSICSSSIVC